jgi:hypothetical protein
MREPSLEVGIMIESSAEPRWRRSTACSAGNCVEVASDGGRILVRDSKNPQIAPMVFTRDEWAVFAAGVREGDFDFG